MDKVLSLRQTRDSLGQRVNAAHFADEFTVITRNGVPRAVVVSYAAFQHLRRGAAGAELGQTAENT